MYDTNLKYGFLTTYDQTVFLKQDNHPTRKRRSVLWYSPIIYHDTPSSMVENRHDKGKDVSNPALYHRKVSLRECFLYLQELAWRDTYVENSMKREAWVTSDKPKFDPYDYISDDPSSSSEEDNHGQPTQGPSTSASRSSTRRGNMSDSVTDIERRAGRLTLSDHRPQPHSQLPWRPGDFVVHFNEKARKWYYEYKGGQVYVELYTEQYVNSPPFRYFVVNGYRHLVRDKGKQRKT